MLVGNPPATLSNCGETLKTKSTKVVVKAQSASMPSNNLLDWAIRSDEPHKVPVQRLNGSGYCNRAMLKI